MSKEQTEAERIIKLYVAGNNVIIDVINGKCVPYKIIKNNAIKCAIIHAEGVIAENKNTYQWAKNINLEPRCVHGLSRSIDYWQTILTILNNK